MSAKSIDAIVGVGLGWAEHHGGGIRTFYFRRSIVGYDDVVLAVCAGVGGDGGGAQS